MDPIISLAVDRALQTSCIAHLDLQESQMEIHQQHTDKSPGPERFCR